MRRAEVAGAVEESDEDRTISIHSAGAGYRDDGDAGLLHVGARYYDPQVGRFISRDAVLSEQGPVSGWEAPDCASPTRA